MLTVCYKQLKPHSFINFHFCYKNAPEAVKQDEEEEQKGMIKKKAGKEGRKERTF
jgi:hypothetical protein